MSKPRSEVAIERLPGEGPVVLFLPGLGARGSGFRALARTLSGRVRPVLVEYPDGAFAAAGAGALAKTVLAAAGRFHGVVASSFGGMVATHLAHRTGAGVAFLGSFTDPAQLGLRGRLIAAMGPIATVGRPGRVAASLAAARLVRADEVAEIVPTLGPERWGVWHRVFALGAEPPPSPLVDAAVPCVALQGGRDLLVPPSTLLRLGAALPKGSALHVLPDAGHVPYFTHPAECARLLSRWIAELPGEGLTAESR